MNGFTNVHRKLLLCLDRTRKGLLPLFHFLCGLLCAEFVMNNLQSTGFLHSAVGGGAVWTVDSLLSEREDGFSEALSLKVLKVGSPETFEVCAAVRFLEQHLCTSLPVRALATLDIINGGTYLAYAL